jgi:3-dehydroquinate dehydratase-2
MMKNILLVHGANLNQLGQRDPEQYGTLTLEELEHAVKEYAASQNFAVSCFQSNHEGTLIDILQTRPAGTVGIIINPGAYAHYSYALHDAIIDTCLPTVEVHLSDITAREPWRAHSVIKPVCARSISGKKLQGYFEAVDYLAECLHAD